MAKPARAKGVTVELEGLDDLRAKLEKLPEQARKGAGDALEESAEAIADGMRDGVSVDSGTLRDSINAKVDRGALTAEIGPDNQDADYGYYQEFGTSSMPAQPFALPAAESERGRFPDRVTQHVTESIPEA